MAKRNRNKKATTGNKDADRALRRVRMTMRAKLIVFAILTIGLAITLLFATQINHGMGLDARLTNKTDTPDETLTAVKDGDMTVHFVDVGQGDCTIIQFPDGKTMIVDGGDKDQKENVLSYIANNVKKKNGSPIEYFDYCVLTHTDSDHCGSLDDVLNEYPAKVVYRPNVVCNAKGYTDPVLEKTKDTTADANVKLWYGNETNTTSIINSVTKKSTIAYKEFLEAAYDSDNKDKLPSGTTTEVVVSDGRRNAWRPAGKKLRDIKSAAYEYEVAFWAPLGSVYKDWNNYSNIMTLKYNNRTLMITGDAEKEAEAEFVEAYADAGLFFNVDVFKLGHHGSRTSSSAAMLEAVMRKDGNGKFSACYFVASCGLNNKYGHPHKETLERLTSYGVPEDHVLRTDKSGTILLSIDKDGAAINGVVAVAPTYTADVQDLPLDWWHIAVTVEGVGFIAIFLIVGTKKRKETSQRRNKKSKNDKNVA